MSNAVDLTGRMRREYHYLKGLMAHPRTPIPARWCIAAALGYLLSPVDIIPDFIPLLGQLDDLVVLGVFVGIAHLLIPDQVKKNTRQRTRSIKLLPQDNTSQSIFETESLPGEFGVRIYRDRLGNGDPQQVVNALMKVLVDQKLVVVQRALHHRITAPPHRSSMKTVFRDPKLSAPPIHLHLSPCTCDDTVLEFADMAAAYAALPETVRQQLMQLRIRRVINGNTILEVPMVSVHPLTGNRYLSGGLSACKVCDLPESEGFEILHELHKHVAQKTFRYTHSLKPNEIIAWDGTAVHHLPPSDALRHESVAGPVAYRLTLLDHEQRVQPAAWT